ncbi:MAG: hypothetical protein ACQERJ_09710 [Bacillota bacterium]
MTLKKINGLDSRMDSMESRQSEMYQILRGLEEKTTIHGSKLNNIEHDVAEVKIGN